MESYGDFYFVAIYKKIGLKCFDENFKDYSSNCPQPNGIKKLRGSRAIKI
jgi:hypothetical protein